MSPTADRHSRDPVATSTVSRMIGVVDAIVSARGDKPRRGSRRTLHDTRFAAAAVGMALLLIAIGVEHYWLRDLKFDDAWIHFRYARNLAQGKGFVYNDGERVLGSGGIAWNLILALLARATGPDALSGGVSLMNFVTLVGFAASPLHRFFRQAPQRIKTFEFKAAVIAEQPVQTSELQHNWRIMVTALDSGTLATGTPHGTQTFRRANLISEIEGGGLREDTKKTAKPARILSL